MKRRIPTFTLLVLAAQLLVGCTEELQHDLPEQDANDIMVLLREHGIKAKKVRQEGGGEAALYMVSVGQQDSAAAVKLLREYSLPRTTSEGLSTFRKKKGMIPTQTEERAILLEALGGEVSMALQRIDGVLEARSIISVPEVNDLTQLDKKPEPTASVLVRYRAMEGKPPITQDAIREFVSTAVPEMKREKVTVILSEARPPSLDANPGMRAVDVLGIQVLASSASQLKIMLAMVGVLVLGLSIYLVWTLVRSAPSPAPARRTVRPPDA